MEKVLGSQGDDRQPVVLVTDATSQLGRAVVGQLLLAGKRVRAVVPDMNAGKVQLKDLKVAGGGALELVAKPDSDAAAPRQMLTPKVLRRVQSVINCGGSQELKNLIPAVTETVGSLGGQPVFSAGSPSLGLQWAPLDDVVMGGCSLGKFETVAGSGEEGGTAAVFSGNVSTDNSGGFSSVRTLNMDPPLNLSAYSGVSLRLRGDGQRYKFILRTDQNWDTVTYCQSFDTEEGEWQDVQLPFDKFIPVFRARSLPDGDPLDSSNIVSLQLMLSKFEYDGALNPSFSAGSFSLPLSSISAYMAQPVSPRFIHLATRGSEQANADEEDIRDSGMPYLAITSALAQNASKMDGKECERLAEVAVKMLTQTDKLNAVMKV